MAVKKGKVKVQPLKIKKVVKEKEEKKPVIKKERYLECTFCGTKSNKIYGRDETSSWCQACGKCFPAIWKED
jgi:hypothetical protein